MKKLILGLLMCSTAVSPVFAAQEKVSPEDKIKNMVAYNILSDDMNYQGDVSMKKIGGVYNVTIPAGSLKTNPAVRVPAFSFPLKNNGNVQGEKRYQISLDKFVQIFPALNSVLQEHKATYAAVRYVGDFVPALDLVENQEVEINNLAVPVDENSKVSVGLIRFTDKSTLGKDKAVKQDTALAFKNINLTHSLATVTIQNFDLSMLIPQAYKEKTPLAQISKTPEVTQKMAISGVRISSPLVPDEVVSFNLNQSLSVTQDQAKGKDYAMVMKGSIDLNELKAATLKDMPSAAAIQFTAQGFNFAQMLAYSAATQKANEIENLPETPRKAVLLKSVEKEAEQAYDALVEKMTIDVEKVSVISDKYTALLKGQIVPKKERFKGTLTISNFDYLAPEPKKVDELACQAVMDKMLAGTLTGDAFKQAFDSTCDEKRGALDALRPYAASARQVKAENGADALMFDIDVQDDDLYINGQKVEDEKLPF